MHGHNHNGLGPADVDNVNIGGTASAESTTQGSEVVVLTESDKLFAICQSGAYIVHKKKEKTDYYLFTEKKDPD